MIPATDLATYCVIVLGLLVVAAPVITYFCVKCGTYAYFKGKRLYLEDQEKRNEEA